MAALEVTKQKTEEARKIAAFNEAKAKSAVKTVLKRLETDEYTIPFNALDNQSYFPFDAELQSYGINRIVPLSWP